MYNPRDYLTEKVAAEVLAEFQWPAPYQLDDCLPDGIAVIFPKCTLLFSEGFESDMELYFSPEDTGFDESITLTGALISLREIDPARLGPNPPLIDKHIPGASLEKVQIGIRNLSMLMLAHLPTCMLGDFSWLEAYKAYRARAAATAP
jgi:hypothetical protein